MQISDLLTRLSNKWLMALSVGLVGLTGVVDHITGAEIQVAVLYLIPVALVTWYVSRGAGFTIAMLSSVVWLVTQYTASSVPVRSFVGIWNATIFLCFFLLVAILLAKIHDTLYRIKQEVRERLEVEAKLARSEELYRTLVETAGDVMWAQDLNLKYTYVSPSVTKLLGYSVEEIMVSDPLDGLTSASRERVLQAFREEMEKEYPNPRERHVSHSVEVQRYHKDGTLRWMQYNATFLRNCQRLPIGILGISRDITERKKAEEVLQEAHEQLERRVAERTHELTLANEKLVLEIGERQRAERALGESLAQFRVLVEQIPAITYAAALDENASTLYVSPQVEMFLGISQDDFKTDPEMWRNRLHPDDRERVLREFTHSRETGERFRSEYRMNSIDGRTLWFRDEAILVCDKSGQPICVQGVMLDITHAKLAHEALRGSEERFRTIFEMAYDGIFIKDRDLRFIHVNPAWLEAHKLSRELVIGKTAEEFFSREEAERIRGLELRVLNGEIVETQHEWVLVGQGVTLHTVRVPLRHSSGQVVGLCGTSRDITEQTSRDQETLPFQSNWNSAIFEETLAKLHLAAESDSTVLLLGESGTGKDYLAHYLHRHSPRSGGPFFSINCAALPSELAESELFGHEAGAFTGAQRRKRGLLELAEGGTLLLNEIGELAPRVQAKLLQFL
ncbi:MAG: PAS domain S-box protein, partial [Desulfomonilaceae bacterium]